MGLTYHNLNIEHVLIRYATDDDNDDLLCGVMVRGINEDIQPLLDPEAHVLDRINAQIKAAKEFRAECARPDESRTI